MDYQRLKQSHAAFKEPSFTSVNHLYLEYSAMKASAMTDAEWYSLSRPERAARVAHHLIEAAAKAADTHDQLDRAKQEAKNK